MAHEARELARGFLSGDTKKPANEARIARIRQLFDLNRRVMDFLAKRKSTPVTPRHGTPRRASSRHDQRSRNRHIKSI